MFNHSFDFLIKKTLSENTRLPLEVGKNFVKMFTLVHLNTLPQSRGGEPGARVNI